MSVPGDIQSYQIEQELRVADWGRSYLATAPGLKGKVVLKFITHPTARQSDWRARFQQRISAIHALAQSTALPIVPIYHWGALEEPYQTPDFLIPAQTPYLILGYIKGSSLGEMLDGPLPFPRAARLLNQIAAALDAVHATGTVHANLKPDNILFDASETLYLTDFHLLLPSGGYLLNLSQKMSLEEAQYISPEQAHTDQTVGPASDVYNLGLIFYEMVTGKRPFTGHSPAQLIRRHAFDPPPPARRHNPALPAELDAILQKALDKNHLARYQSAGEMAAAVWRLLPAEQSAEAPTPLPVAPKPPPPVPAAAPPPSEMFSKPPFAPTTPRKPEPPRSPKAQPLKELPDKPSPAPTSRRPKSLSILIILVTLIALCLCGMITMGVLFYSSGAAPAETTQSQVVATAVPLPPTPAGSILDLLAATPGGQPAQTGPRSLIQLAQFGEGTVRAIAPSPADGPIAIAGPLGVKLYDERTLAPLEQVSGEPTTAVAWLDNGRLLAWPTGGGNIEIRDKGGELRQQLNTANFSSVSHLAASPDGRQLAALLTSGELYLWTAANGNLIGQWDFSPERVRFFTWSPKGDQLALTTDAKSVRLISSKTGETQTTLTGSPFNLAYVAWSPDGTTLAAITVSGYLLIWSLPDGVLLHEENARASAISWVDDGRSLLVGGQDGWVHFREAGTWEQVEPGWVAQETAVYTLHWLPDPARLLTFGEDGWLRLHDGQRGHLLAERPNFNSADYNAVSDLAWSPDGRSLAASSWDRTIRVWSVSEAAVSQVLRGHRSYITALDWSPDGAWLASGSLDSGGPLRLWPLPDGEAQSIAYEDDSPVTRLAFSPDGRWLAVGLRSGLLAIQPTPPGQDDRPLLSGRPREEAITDLAWSPDNSHLLVANQKGNLSLWQLPDGALAREWEATANSFDTRLDWSATAPLAAVGDDMAEIQLWGSADWQLEQSLTGLSGVSLNEVAFAENGRWLAIVGGLRQVLVFDLESGQIAFVGEGHGAAIRAVAWSPANPAHLATGGDDGTIRLWLLTEEEMGR